MTNILSSFLVRVPLLLHFWDLSENTWHKGKTGGSQTVKDKRAGYLCKRSQKSTSLKKCGTRCRLDVSVYLKTLQPRRAAVDVMAVMIVVICRVIVLNLLSFSITTVCGSKSSCSLSSTPLTALLPLKENPYTSGCLCVFALQTEHDRRGRRNSCYASWVIKDLVCRGDFSSLLVLKDTDVCEVKFRFLSSSRAPLDVQLQLGWWGRASLEICVCVSERERASWHLNRHEICQL